jgi:hypothetical protein
MDSYPYSVAAFAYRRELEPSTLNGDAHHSLFGRVELRIGRCRIIKDSIAAEHSTIQSTQNRVLSAEIWIGQPLSFTPPL